MFHVKHSPEFLRIFRCFTWNNQRRKNIYVHKYLTQTKFSTLKYSCYSPFLADFDTIATLSAVMHCKKSTLFAKIIDFGTQNSSFLHRKHGNLLPKRFKTASEKTKHRKLPQLFVFWPEFFGIWPAIWTLEIVGIFPLSSNEATKSPVFESKSLCFVQRNGKFTDFDLKKTLLRCLRAIFGALFPVLAGKKPPIFLTKGVFSCPFSESGTFFPPIPAIFANQTGVNTVKMQLSG